MFTNCNKIRVFFKIIISQSYHTLCKIKVLIWWRIHVWRYFKNIVIDFKFIIDPLSKINLLPFQLVVPREPPLPSQKLFTSLYRMRCQKPSPLLNCWCLEPRRPHRRVLGLANGRFLTKSFETFAFCTSYNIWPVIQLL